MAVRIVLADEHTILRAGLRSILSSDPEIKVAGEAANFHALLQVLRAQQPDILITEFGLCDLDGEQVIHSALLEAPRVRVLVLSAHEDYETLSSALHVGAMGFLTKRASVTDLLSAVRALMQGELYIQPTLAHLLMTNSANSPAVPLMEPKLSPREMQVLRLIVLGYTNRQIASELNIGVRTVESHRAHLVEKIGLHHRADLVQFAFQLGLIQKPAQVERRKAVS